MIYHTAINIFYLVQFASWSCNTTGFLMASSSRKTYPKRSNRVSTNYTYFEYDSCTEGLDSEEEEEIVNIILQGVLEENVDFDVDCDIESHVGSGNIVVGEEREADITDFVAVDIPAKKKVVKGIDRQKKKLPSSLSSSSSSTIYKSYHSPVVDANQLPPFSPI